MKISDILTDESKWTKKTFARNNSGHRVKATDPNAVRFCLFGAADRASQIDPANNQIHLLSMAEAELGGKSISEFNDDPKTTFADIQAFLKRNNL